MTASEDKTIRVWDCPGGKSVGGPIKLPRGSLRPRFNATGDYFTAVIGGKRIFVWPFDRPTEPIVLEHPAGANQVLWSPDGTTLATCGKDRRLRLWSIPAGKLLDESFKTDTTDLTSAAYAPDGQTIILGSHFFSSKAMYTEVFGWNVADRKSTFRERYEKEVWYVSAVAPDGQQFLSGAWAKTTRLMRTADGKTVTEFAPQMDPPVSVKGTTFSPDGRQVLICAGNTAQIWSGF